MTGIAAVGVGVQAPEGDGPVVERELIRGAVEKALADAGLERSELDGYIGTMGPGNLRYLGLSPLTNIAIQAGGASAGAAMALAAGIIRLGQVKHFLITYVMAPTATRRPTGSTAYGYPMLYGMFGPPSAHALHARKHMAMYGTTSEQMGMLAVVQREYALDRTMAVGYQQPMTLEAHQASRMVVDPFRLLDCCRDADLSVAVIVTSDERAADQKSPAAYLAGIGFGNNVRNWHRGTVYENHDDIAPAAKAAFGQAGLTLEDVDVAQLYDPHTMSVIMQLEHYGFCEPGEGGPFVADGQTRPDGAIPTNTGGGQLSGWYATGFTPLVEGIQQVRGLAESGQFADVEVALVAGHGGNAGIHNTWSHATMLFTRDRR